MILIFVLFIAAFFIYVEIANRNSVNMTYRQKILKAVYPLWMWYSKLKGKNAGQLQNNKQPPVSFYTLKARLNNGEELDFANLKGKKIMIVNTASNCGYTDQYFALQKLFEERSDKLMIIGFPANDFKQQEKGTDEEISAFCKANYGVSFPIVQKSVVLRSSFQNPVYRWLTDSTLNGWNNKQPSWNFTKYIVNENGVLTHYFGPSISPLSNAVKKAIEQ
jgi:glutathione peroxidase